MQGRTDLTFTSKTACAAVTALLIAFTVAYAQMQRLSFEAVSIKPHVFTGGGALGTRVSGSLVTISITTVNRLIQEAYDVKEYQVIGGPDWMSALADAYDIVARAPGDERPTPDQLKQMMQSVLEDRFKLKLHRDRREIPVYRLIVAKSGTKLTANAGGASSARASLFPTRRLNATAMQTSYLISMLTNELRRPVYDETALTGRYDFTLEWTPNPVQTAARDANTEPSGVPDIVTAVEEQLGLKLESTKRLIEVLVIDHVEKPTEN
jgi:uncharacterized protein (TIGR03435 family)